MIEKSTYVNYPAQEKSLYNLADIILIIAFACIPLFFKFPYRINIFLSWEGAYRISEGQIPFKDFGMPLGYMYWVIPALFFKFFGASLITLVKAQVFINIISGFAFRSILKSLDVSVPLRILSVLLFCLSYSFINFWPWYNHTVIVYEFVALAFLLKGILKADGTKRTVFIVLAGLFTFCSFFTKQDGGALCFLLCIALVAANALIEKKLATFLIYIGSVLVFGILFIYPLTQFQFGYWFNHGQPPHQARVSVFEIADEFFYSSQWIKFYFLIIILLLVMKLKKWNELINNKREFIFLLLIAGILVEATIIQITSYTPPEGNIFYHSFAFAYIFTELSRLLQIDYSVKRFFLILFLGVMIWWSGSYWKYISRFLETTNHQAYAPGNENVVNRKTYILNDDTLEIPQSQWITTDLPYFEKIKLPKPTVEGIERLKQLPQLKQPAAKVLNMTELTPLAAIIPFKLETGENYPLWFHLGVGMFNKQAEFFEDRFKNRYYDAVLFEYIPRLNNFYPFRSRDILMKYYNRVDSFYAPRSGNTPGLIEVYLPK
jgi:hypothetical protein